MPFCCFSWSAVDSNISGSGRLRMSLAAPEVDVRAPRLNGSVRNHHPSLD